MVRREFKNLIYQMAIALRLDLLLEIIVRGITKFLRFLTRIIRPYDGSGGGSLDQERQWQERKKENYDLCCGCIWWLIALII